MKRRIRDEKSTSIASLTQMKSFPVHVEEIQLEWRAWVRPQVLAYYRNKDTVR